MKNVELTRVQEDILNILRASGLTTADYIEWRVYSNLRTRTRELVRENLDCLERQGLVENMGHGVFRAIHISE